MASFLSSVGHRTIGWSRINQESGYNSLKRSAASHSRYLAGLNLMSIRKFNLSHCSLLVMTAVFAVCFIIIQTGKLLSCPGCVGGGNTQTLPKECDAADIVLFGTLSNAKWTDVGGTTDLAIETVLKDHKLISGKKSIVLDRGLGIPENKKMSGIIFAAVFNGQIDPYRIVQDDDKSICNYLQGALQLPADDITKRLAYFFKFLDNSQLEISLDAYRAFAHATAIQTHKAVAAFDRQKLLTWLADPKTPKYRISLYGYLLGLCGKPEDARVLRQIIENCDPSSSVAIEGPMIGLAMLDSKSGLSTVTATLYDPKKDYQIRFGALQASRILLNDFPGKVDSKVIFDAMGKAIEIEDSADIFVD